MSSQPPPTPNPGGVTGATLGVLASQKQLPIPGLGPSAGSSARGILGRFFNSTVSQAAAFAAGMATRDPMKPVLQDLTNEVWKLHQSRPLSPENAASAVERGEMTMDEAAEEASLTGINANRFRILERLAGLAPAPEQLMTMFRRGVIDQARLHKGLVQGNVRLEWADAIIGVAKAIPSISDMVRFAVREAYGGGSALSGTTDELPGELVTELAKHGFEEKDASHYWAAHWHLPSPTQAYVMFHRGLMGRSELIDLLRVSDYPPFWRDKLADIAYHVPGRIDLRRMLEHDVIDEPRVLKGYKDLGYDDENAAILTALAVELAKPKAAANPHKTNWAERALGMAFTDVHGWLKKGDMSEAQATAALEAVGIDSAAAAAAAGYWATVLAAHG